MVYQLMGSVTGSEYQQVTSGWSSASHAISNNTDMMHHQPISTVCKHAMLKKIKTNKNKFFVLHKDSATAPARLEYYDSESHWNKKKKAKRTIYLRACFSINAFSDTRVKYGMAIFTKDDSFQIGFDSEQTRDMWLADMRLLSHSSTSQGHGTVAHMWHVRAQTRSMKSSFEGDFKLCLNEQQASLISKEDPQQVLVLPLEVITHCVLNNRYFALEVNHSAQTGPGEIWMELEDALIAQHVHRAFMQNWSMACPAENGFRPMSKSLSFKDKNAAVNARLRSGSDAKLRSRIGQTLYKYSALALSTGNFSGMRRDRSDSVDSHSTTASLSTDESDCCHNWQSASRSVTPDMRSDSQSQYMPMNMGRKSDDNCKCLSSTSSLSSEAAHADSHSDVSSVCNGKPHDRNYNFMYMDMSSNVPYLDTQHDKADGYIDMTVGTHTSPNTKGYNLKPEPVRCYLSEEGSSVASSTLSETSPKAKPQVNNTQTSEYVEMCRKHMLTGRDKSSSAPHLIPVSQYQQQRADTDLFMNLEFDNRDRTASLSCAHRPRGSSWSQFIRPRSSTTEQKRRTRNQRASNNNISESPTDYIDMTRGSITGGYVEMSLDRTSKQRLELIRNQTTEKEDKENRLPLQTSPRVQPVVAHPFPELMSASSEDDVSLNSMEGSMSLHSLTSSADSMSTSSHSSHHSTAFVSALDAEPYVAMQNSPVSTTTNSYVRSNTHRLLLKPARVSSYIVDELEDTSKSTNHSDYVEMSPSGSRQTKQ